LQRKKAMYDSSDNPLGDFFASTPDARDAGRGVFDDSYAPTGLLEQTRCDGLSLPAISVALRRWALQQEDVDKVAVGLVGTQYSIAVLFTRLQPERVFGLYPELAHILSRFGGCIVLLYPLGPTQQDSQLLNGPDCYAVYPA
jgi:hypothetical protein